MRGAGALIWGKGAPLFEALLTPLQWFPTSTLAKDKMLQQKMYPKVMCNMLQLTTFFLFLPTVYPLTDFAFVKYAHFTFKN